jgi:diaminopimelate epimerase
MKIKFSKMVASGNDFVVIDNLHASCVMRHASSVKKICDRKYGIGADGLLVLEKSKKADIRMRIFNADGSQAQMCGNGARCVALYCIKKERGDNGGQLEIETRAGIINAEVAEGVVKIRLTDPKGIKLDLPIRVFGRTLKVNFINTGVPHTVIFVEGLDKINVFDLGRQIRFHKQFAPAGTNVDFVEVIKNDYLRVRTYERGVEDETLACGTGSVASALIFASRYCLLVTQISVHTQSGEILKVYLERYNNNFHDVWLEGKARIVYQGEYYV